MDINCTLPCLHQVDGKCALIVVPDMTGRQAIGYYEGIDCAYFKTL